MSEEVPLVVIAGPTGSGKSELALHVAARFNGEIVNCDSLQVYRYFDLGTAKLKPSERRGIPHHLLDVLDPSQLFTAGEYARAGRAVLRDITARERLPVITGGTGFYLRALLEGLSPGEPADQQFRERLLGREAKRAGSLHRLLSRLDREAALRIHAHDIHKTLRALELRLARSAPASTLEPPLKLSGFRALKVGLNPDRGLLYARLNQRLARMFDDGLVGEVRAILARGIGAQAKPFQSLGYKEALLLLEGRLKRDAAITLAQTATRQYAKRQLTWFRRDADIHWFGGFGNDPEIQAAVCSHLGSLLS